MWNEASTLGQLRKAVDYWIEVHGEHCRVGCEIHAPVEGESPETKHRCVADAVFLEWVFVDDFARVVGTEGEDYTPKPGEVSAVIML